MNKIITVLLLFISLSLYSQEKWDNENKIYVNFDYGFSWHLDENIDWKKTIGSEKHTVFRVKASDIPIILFINIQDYNKSLENKDIWDYFEKITSANKQAEKTLLTKGYQVEFLSTTKVKLFGNHAIKTITKTSPIKQDILSEIPSVKYSIKTIHKGRLFSVCINIPLSLYNKLLKENIDIEYLYSGFKFTAS